VAAESLRDELLGIPGVVAADFEGNSENPDGVKVRLDAGVDVETVGEEIQRVLTEHGLRSELAGQRGRGFPDDEPAAPEGAGGVTTAVLDEAAPEDGDVDLISVEPVAPEPVIILDSVEPTGPRPASAPGPVPGLRPGLEAVAVEEGRHGVLVRARHTSGAEAARRATPTGPGLDEAVVAAVAELHGASILPMIISIAEQTIDGTRVVTVMLEVGRENRVVGSAVFDGGRAYAVGRAAWAALSSA
jgi:hypothetical protein